MYCINEKKISIIVPCYGTEKYLERCLNSLINQTYKNIEIVVVNDASPDNTAEILKKYELIDNRIKIINHSKNKGLYKARITGVKNSTGDFIAFVDSDDFVELDYYRELINLMVDNDADVVFSNIVKHEEQNDYVYNLFAYDYNCYDNQKLVDNFFAQEGKNYSWHVVWNKLYKKTLWDDSISILDSLNKHIIMTEDLVFSTIVLLKAKKVCFNERANYFYCVNDDAATSINNLKVSKVQKSINDLVETFRFVKKYLINIQIYNKYSENLENWKSLYAKIWYDNVKKSKLSRIDKEILISKLFDFDKKFMDKNFENKDIFYSLTTNFNNNLIKLKQKIIKSDVISFDIFDTLINRPFLEPKDMFKLLNKKFNNLFNNVGLIDFSTIRIDAEKYVRKKLYNEGLEEITLSSIYDFISDNYDLDRKKLHILEEEEINLEYGFCKRRNTAYSLYTLAKSLNKKVIITSDMYLEKEIIINILKKNGYDYFDELFLSSDQKLTKWSGNLFKLILKKYSGKILHIGDNYSSDVEIPKTYGLSSFFFPSTTTIFFNFASDYNDVGNCGRLNEYFNMLNIEHGNYTEYYSNRCSIALVSNKFFDNPFVTFNSYSDFNCNPYLIGYYVLGMHILSLSKWLLDSTSNYNSLVFMARDGYLPYLATNELKELYKNKPMLEYVYLSRKSLFPLSVKTLKDLYKLKEYFNLSTITINEIILLLKNILKLPNDYKKQLNDNNFNINKNIFDNEEYCRLMKFIYKNFYDKEKYNNYLKIAKKYFSDKYIGKSATFDIGYSGQPELILSNILNKKIDTYFIHTNSDIAFNKSKTSGYKLNTFYQFKPTFTGTLREYLISSLEQSCVSYKIQDNQYIPVFENKKIFNYFDIRMLNIIQSACLDFVKDFKNVFEYDIFDMEFNHYYMSIPFEYFMHYSKDTDRLVFSGLNFDQNIGEQVKMLDFWKQRINEYNNYCNKYAINSGNEYRYNDFLNERVNNRNILFKLIFYILYDRVALKNKIGKNINIDKKRYTIIRKVYRYLRKIKHILD